MINYRLYNALVEACTAGKLPDRQVKVVHAGEPMVASYRTDPVGRVDLMMRAWGETYAVCCPGCGDTRHRLHINHRWAERDPRTGRRHIELIKCFNENCQAGKDFGMKLLATIYPVVAKMGLNGLDVKLPGVIYGGDCKLINPYSGSTNRMACRTARVIPTTMIEPGELHPLHTLPDNHPAIRFIRNRGFSAERLEQNWGVQFCHYSDIPAVTGRLVFPITHDGKTVSWQARYVGDGSGGSDKLWRCDNFMCGHTWSADSKPRQCPKCNAQAQTHPTRVPKWYTCPGTRIGDQLYNYDVAKHWPFVVLCEGPLDPIRLGTPDDPDVPGPGVCVFGHSLTLPQRNVLSVTPAWKNGVVFLLFDDDLYDDPRETAKLQILERTLQARLPNARVLPVRLPEKGSDPGSTPHDVLWRTLQDTAKTAGIYTPGLEPAVSSTRPIH